MAKIRRLKQRFKSLDLFGQPIEMQVDGGSKVKSNFSAFVSLLLLIWISVYIVKQSIKVYQRKSYIDSNIQHRENSSIPLNFSQIDMPLAFALSNYLGTEDKMDPQYVRLNAFTQYFGRADSDKQVFKIQKCNQTEMDKFYAPDIQSKTVYENIKKRNDWWCIQDFDQITIKGKNDYAEETKTLEVQVIPCDSNYGVKDPNIACNKTQEQTQNYLANTLFFMLYNIEQFEQQKFDDKTFQKSARINVVQYNWLKPQFSDQIVIEHRLSDQTSFLQLGHAKETKFYDVYNKPAQDSNQIDWPHQYKFISVEINYGNLIQIIERETYDILTCLGDTGGLYSALLFLGQSFTFWQNQGFHKQFFNRKLFRKRKQKSLHMKLMTNLSSNMQLSNEQQLINSIKQEFNNREPIPRYNLFTALWNACCPSKKSKALNRILNKGQSIIDKELDVVHIIKAQRLNNIFFQGVLNKNQQLFASKLAEQALSSSSESGHSDKNQTEQNNTSFAEKIGEHWFQREVQDHQVMKNLHDIVSSAHIVDKRLINLFKQQEQSHLLKYVRYKDSDEIDQLQNLQKLIELKIRPSARPLTEIQNDGMSVRSDIEIKRNLKNIQ